MECYQIDERNGELGVRRHTPLEDQWTAVCKNGVIDSQRAAARMWIKTARDQNGCQYPDNHNQQANIAGAKALEQLAHLPRRDVSDQSM